MPLPTTLMLDPDAGARHIENGRVAATTLGLLGRLVGLGAPLVGSVSIGSSLVLLADAGIMFGFARGYARRSRIASVLCLIYQGAAIILHWKSLSEPAAIAVFLGFGYFFLRGTLAVFEVTAEPTDSTRP